MFRGQYIHSISKTGRVSLPAKFRDLLEQKYSSNKVIVSLFENCIVGYPITEWENLESKILTLPPLKKNTVDFERYLIGNASECVIDTEGRINIPPLLRKNLKLNQQVVFIGILTRFEIWNETYWNKENKASFKKFQKSRDTIDGI